MVINIEILLTTGLVLDWSGQVVWPAKQMEKRPTFPAKWKKRLGC